MLVPSSLGRRIKGEGNMEKRTNKPILANPRPVRIWTTMLDGLQAAR